jgi:hypothetical protein
MDAVKTRAAHHIEEVLHLSGSRIDKAMGLAPTRLAICAFYMVGRVSLLHHNDDEFYNDSRLASRYWW